MKQILSILLCFALIVISCSACSFSGKNEEKDASLTPPTENVTSTEEEKESSDIPSSDSTAAPDAAEETELPEVEIPLAEGPDDELIDPSELPETSESDVAAEPSVPDLVIDEDLITDNDEIQIDEDGTTILPEIPLD